VYELIRMWFKGFCTLGLFTGILVFFDIGQGLKRVDEWLGGRRAEVANVPIVLAEQEAPIGEGPVGMPPVGPVGVVLKEEDDAINAHVLEMLPLDIRRQFHLIEGVHLHQMINKDVVSGIHLSLYVHVYMYIYI
jgi:hypothetical protein